jgi:predicted phage terminase large subunit-like protein
MHFPTTEAKRQELTRFDAKASSPNTSRAEQEHLLGRYREVGNEWIKRSVINRNRIDMLGEMVLGYTLAPHHLAMLHFLMSRRQGLVLAFRGSGKSTICTILRSIYEIIRDPNIRILLASKSHGNAKGFLREIKNQFERNERLIEIFGNFVGGRKWGEEEVEVMQKTSTWKEPTISTVGVGSTVVSKHYDMINGDDLVDGKNARTITMREQMLTWYYMTLHPTLIPFSEKNPNSGKFPHEGTRFNYADMYGYLIANEFADDHLIIPALSPDGVSAWEEEYPAEHFIGERKKKGSIIFNAQYQCNAAAMKGALFRWDWIQWYAAAERPKTGRVYMGVDLAIGEKATNDCFAIVVISVTDSGHIYIVDWYEGRKRFSEQADLVEKYAADWNPIRIGIESNAYQAALAGELVERNAALPIKKVYTKEDKITRAERNTALFEAHRVFICETGSEILVDRFLMFPNDPKKDLVDAFDFAVQLMRKGNRHTRRKRDGKVGII